MSKKKSEYYNILSNVARQENFDPDQLVRMFIAESSGDPNVVNSLGYTGGFQFGEEAGKEYGLVGEGFDYRKDLGKSAKAAIDMYKKNLKDEVITKTDEDTGEVLSSWRMSNVYNDPKGLNIGEDLAGYLTHQQGRSGFLDIITGAESGNISPITKKNMLSNIGHRPKNKDGTTNKEYERISSLPNKELTNEFLNIWKKQWGVKTIEANEWLAEAKSPIASLQAGGRIEDQIIANMLKQERGLFG